MLGVYSIVETRDGYLDNILIMNLIISTLYWKKYNGDTKLYCDKNIYKLFSDLKIIDIWDYVDYQLLEDWKTETTINLPLFWASPKVKAISNENIPFVSIDIDNIILKDLNEYEFYDSDISIPFTEIVNHKSEQFYPNDFLNINFKFPDDFNFKCDAINCSLVYYNNQELLDDYTKLSLSYMQYISEHSSIIDNMNPKLNNLTYILFAEQRLLGEIVGAHSQKIKSSKYNYICLLEDSFETSMFGNSWIKDINSETRKITQKESFEIAIHLGNIKNSLKKDKGKRATHQLKQLRMLEKITPHWDRYFFILDELSGEKVNVS
jgi:hypothetical protein